MTRLAAAATLTSRRALNLMSVRVTQHAKTYTRYFLFSFLVFVKERRRVTGHFKGSLYKLTVPLYSAAHPKGKVN